MGHTNSTANYNLPQFVGTDKPSWLGDINNAFSAIDTAIANAASTATTADGKADALGTTVSGHTTQIGTLSNTVTAQGNTLNTVTALIGNGTPTTTDQTIIGAINELNADRDWTLVDTKTGTTAIDISGLDAKEYLAIVNVIGDATAAYPILIPAAILSSNTMGFRTGAYYSSATNAGIRVNATNAAINLQQVMAGESDVTSTSTISLYAR